MLATVPAPLRLGRHTLSAPVVLAPMAGITNAAFRRLCRELGGGAGLYVSEMVTSRALVERTPESLRLTNHHPDEPVKSVQLYATDPGTAAAPSTHDPGVRPVSAVVQTALARAKASSICARLERPSGPTAW